MKEDQKFTTTSFNRKFKKLGPGREEFRLDLKIKNQIIKDLVQEVDKFKVEKHKIRITKSAIVENKLGKIRTPKEEKKVKGSLLLRHRNFF